MNGRVVLAVSRTDQVDDAISALADGRGDVVTMTLDVGQGQELEQVHEQALSTGAARAHVLDVREDLARDFVLPSLHAGALHGGCDPLPLPLAHMLIAKMLVDVASIESASHVAHCGRGADADRIEAALRALNPALRVTRVARDEGRAGATPAPRSSATLWGREIDCGGGAGGALPETTFHMTNAPAQAPDTPAAVDVDFQRGVPVAVNGVPLRLTELIDSLTIIAGQHGIGRVLSPGAGDATGGSRHALEVPAAAVLHAAHAVLEAEATGAELVRLKRELGAKYAALVWTGGWYSPMRRALDGFNACVQQDVTGSVRIQLHKGCLTVLECRLESRAPLAPNAPAASETPQSGSGAGAQRRAPMVSAS